MPETEQIEWLAREQYRQTILDKALKGMTRFNTEGERTVSDLAAYFQLFMETL